MLMRDGIPQLELWCPHWWILTYVVLAWYEILHIDCSDKVILLWLPQLVIVPNKSLLFMSHMVYAECVTFQNLRRWGIPLFNNLLTPHISMFTQSICMKRILMFCTPLVFTQSATSSGNILSASSIGVGSMMYYVSCSWVSWKTHCTGCSNSWQLEMSSDNLILDSHQYHDIQTSSTALYQSIFLKSGSWNRQQIWGMIRTLAMNCSPNLD